MLDFDQQNLVLHIPDFKVHLNLKKEIHTYLGKVAFILSSIFALSSVQRPVSRHFKEKYLSYLYQI